MDGDPRLLTRGAGRQTLARDVHSLTVRMDTFRPLSFSDDVLFVGLNPDAGAEAQTLRRATHVAEVRPSPVPDQLLLSPSEGIRRRLNLALGTDRERFSRSLGIPREAARRVAEVLAEATPGSRDELARIAQAWAPAERGEPMPGRLVLSGHCAGTFIWGHSRGLLTWNDLGALAGALPHAARHVRDLHIAGCNSGFPEEIRQFRGFFPNLQTLWGYEGTAPGSTQGAAVHLRQWERATRGGTEVLSVDTVRATRKGANVAVWSVRGGFQSGMHSPPVDSVRQDYEDALPAFGRAFTGAEPVRDPHRGALRTYYQRLQALLGTEVLDAPERMELSAQRDRTLRLLYYSTSVAKAFTQAHRGEIARGYRAVGESPPDFSALSRATALGAIDHFLRRAEALNTPSTDADQLARILVGGLRELEPDLVPTRWI